MSVYGRCAGRIALASGFCLVCCFLSQPASASDGSKFMQRPPGKTDSKQDLDFKSAVRDLIGPDQPLQIPPKPDLPKELRIISAKYGAHDKWLDVTPQVTEKVVDNQLSIRASNAIAGDPLYGTSKRLKVHYMVDGKKQFAEVREGVMLNVPPVYDPFDEFVVVNDAERLTALAKACPAEVGFFGRNFVTGRTVEYRPDQPACLASIVKLFVLLEVMRQVDEGTADLSESIRIQRDKQPETTTMAAALDKMIGISDNEATNALAARVGYSRVNLLPRQLGIQGLSDKILPEPGVLTHVLDKRVAGPRLWPASDLLPQHGTARGMVQYFELLNAGRLINEEVSLKVLEVLDGNPKLFATRATPLDCRSVGKGGGLSWTRPSRAQYNMGGWALFIKGDDVALAFCLWCEWFPSSMAETKRREWYTGLSECIVNILLSSGGNASKATHALK